MGLSKAIVMGRITHDLEVRQTPSGTAVLQFTVAVDRNYSKDSEKQTDFINCVAWRQTAEFIGRYFGKGRMIAVDGRLQTRTYEDKNNIKHYITELIVENANFTGEPKQGGGNFNGQNGDAQSVGDLSDFEDVLTEDGSVPF